MRSHSTRSKLNYSCLKIGPTLLSLTLVGAGVAGAVSAQDSAVPNAAAGTDKPALRKELNDLMRQRTQLNSRVNAIRRQLGAPNDISLDLGNGNRTFIFSGTSRAMTADEKRIVQKAMQQALSASHDAMLKAQQALQEASRAPFGNGAGKFVMPAFPPIPNLPSIPKMNFQFNGNNWDSSKWKQFQENFMQEWKKQQPEFEKQMRQFQEQMRQFQQQMKDSTLKFDEENQQPSNTISQQNPGGES